MEGAAWWSSANPSARSVLVAGEARTVTEPHAVERPEAHSRTTPRAGTPRNVWITVTPGRVTGRRIVVRDR
ncbi:hypothetical protein ACGF5F_33145 [Streptomyces sp. NPDC047821]|uniref:hypothetical protein n=1 Tax=Streptomyces sp. NPDC047821 TaxID=3365488 RepID=UPI003718FC8D